MNKTATQFIVVIPRATVLLFNGMPKSQPVLSRLSKLQNKTFIPTYYTSTRVV